MMHMFTAAARLTFLASLLHKHGHTWDLGIAGQPDELTKMLLCQFNTIDYVTALRLIDNYGCWCNFDLNSPSFDADPVDGLDQCCKDRQICLRRNSRCDLGEPAQCTMGGVFKVESLNHCGRYSFICNEKDGKPEIECQYDDSEASVCNFEVCKCDTQFVGCVYNNSWHLNYFKEPIYSAYKPECKHSGTEPTTVLNKLKHSIVSFCMNNPSFCQKSFFHTDCFKLGVNADAETMSQCEKLKCLVNSGQPVEPSQFFLQNVN